MITVIFHSINKSVKRFLRFIIPQRIYHSASKLKRNFPKWKVQKILTFQIYLKWLRDKRHLPLTLEHWEIYQICHQKMWDELNRFPNLINPTDFNDNIQWLKLFDQTKNHIRCSDKIRVREYVEEKVGQKHLVKLYQVCEHFDQIDFDNLPKSFVIKTNHDSGTVILVRDKAILNKQMTKDRIQVALQNRYGWRNGEWAYSFIKPKILVEEFIRPEGESAPADYKFHCVEGKIKWLQFIYDRKRNTKEVIISPSGELMNIHFDQNMLFSREFKTPIEWDELCNVAQTLAEGWKYVRVDLYLEKSRIYVGELTFFPLLGCYRGDGQKSLGCLMDFDRSSFKPPIYHTLQKDWRSQA